MNCVVIPTGDPNKSPTGTPTGQVFNGTADFELAPKTPARFIFVTEDGTVSGWAGGPSATIKVNTHGASVFKGSGSRLVEHEIWRNGQLFICSRFPQRTCERI